MRVTGIGMALLAQQYGSPLFRAMLDAEAVITPADERSADLAAERYGSALFRAMLDATPEGDDRKEPK